MRPAKPAQIFRALKHYTENDGFTLSEENPMAVDQGQRGVITRILEQTEHRYEILAWAFPHEKYPFERSSKTLSDAEWYALWKWVSPEKTEHGWEPTPEFWQEITWILDQIHKERSGMVGVAQKLGGVVRKREDGLR